MVINAIAKHPYALRDAVELDAYDATIATCLLLSVMFHSPYLYVLYLSHFTSSLFRMARLVRPLWNLAHDDFAPD